MARKSNKNNNTFEFFKIIGSSTGAIITIATLMSMCVGAGTFLTKLIKDREILEINTNNSLQVIDKSREISELKIENKELRYKLKIDSISYYNEKRKK
ncbi:hypothetical protein C8J95_102333 [Elizabethkingia sp. YR214]|uniref:hypothetical protein n=1 Tax=Elizabethkingia sp. YR214 TaxID=2135667 RepID=UPI000D316C19|nr:hypothetical protein [Elizabethkingia sp. YR214]PUB34667.1 hypothetical protein C8J95_102333 [Elizabethkingia sp. YR214]